MDMARIDQMHGAKNQKTGNKGKKQTFALKHKSTPS
jgi:hypothetical protein